MNLLEERKKAHKPMHKQTKKLRKLMHNNKSSEEAMALLSLENFKLKLEQTTTLKNSANLRAERERESFKCSCTHFKNRFQHSRSIA
jgi:hypothetical protein